MLRTSWTMALVIMGELRQKVTEKDSGMVTLLFQLLLRTSWNKTLVILGEIRHKAKERASGMLPCP